jgi:hypothetical protein
LRQSVKRNGADNRRADKDGHADCADGSGAEFDHGGSEPVRSGALGVIPHDAYNSSTLGLGKRLQHGLDCWGVPFHRQIFVRFLAT